MSYEAIPLFAAAAAGRAACVRLLLNVGARAAVLDGEGNTALMFACAPEIDPEGRDGDGRTALLGYCLCPHVSVALVRLLLARGAQVHARDVAAERVARLEQEAAAPEEVPADPAQAIAAAARRRLTLRSARLTRQALEGPGAATPASDAPRDSRNRSGSATGCDRASPLLVPDAGDRPRRGGL
jgi:hypothetical protein